MNITEHRGFVVAIFDEDDTTQIIEETLGKLQYNGEDFVWVALDGTEDDYISEVPECSLVENYRWSLINSLMWDGHLTEAERDTRLWEMIDEFIDNGKQVLVEEYEFVEDEPFYDYSGGRE